MKPKLIEVIPFWGWKKYQDRYFAVMIRGDRESTNAQLFMFYHILVGVILAGSIFEYLF